ncbi:MAG: RelA/SpoT domain-containing protein [Alphaproteobacteria bacterium]|nr:RelA/SpoT domain-containing protein [Alphaproteobacteria bacterium]
MKWAKPGYSKSKVDRAGKALVAAFGNDISAYLKVLDVVNNWRSSHNYPLNTFKVTLRKKAAEVDRSCLVAQRIKRLSSIEYKLNRFPTMKLSQMQDLGGCRAIVSDIKQVRRLVEKYEKSDLKHLLDDKDDYISLPKTSGYRGVHLIYKYNSDKKGPSVYNGLNIEMQIRSRLQHAWATSVETVGTFLKQSLKSSQGEEKWLRFFELMGSAIALRENASALVPNTPNKKTELVKELRSITGTLNVANSLKMYGSALTVGENVALRGDHFFLLKLEPSEQRMTVTGFKRKQLEEASQEYLKIECEIADVPGAEAVLVSVDSISSLRKAYPNYFLDTQVFLDALADTIKR